MKIRHWAAIAAVAAAAAWGFWPAGETKKEEGLRTAPLLRGSVLATVSTTGTLQALETVEVGTQVSGVIKEIRADFNDRVEAGQVLARLETDVLEARLAQDEASLAASMASVERARVAVEEAERRLERTRTLAGRGLASPEDVEAAEFALRSATASLSVEATRVVQAEASVRMARTNLGHATITSPIDGVVLDRAVDKGQTVAASLSAPTLFTLARDLSRMRVEASVDEADIGRVKPGQPVRFTVDAHADRAFRGKVSQLRLSPQVVQNVVTYTVIIDTGNPELLLLPGMTANVIVETGRAEDVLIAPAAALRWRPAGTDLRKARADDGNTGRGEFLWALENGQPKPIRVSSGVSDGMRTEVSGEGLAEGLEIIVGDGNAAGNGDRPVSPFRLMMGGPRPGGGGGGNRGR